MTAFALSLVRQPADAADLIQSTLTRLIEKRVLPSVPLAYVLTTMKRLVHDRVRRRRSASTVSFAEALFPGVAIEPSDRIDESRRLIDAVARLSDDEAEVILLHTIADLSLRDLASVLGKPLGTVATLHRRGMARLAEILADDQRRAEVRP